MKLLFTAALLFSLFISMAQKDHSDYNPPVFGSGRSDFHKYLNDSLHYPQLALSKNLFDNYNIVIYISREGRVSDVFIKGKENSFKREIKRVLLNMPVWQPATLKGINIDTTFHQKIYFSLDQTQLRSNDTTSFECLRTPNLMPGRSSVWDKSNATVWGQIVNGNAMDASYREHWVAAYDLYLLAEERGLTTVDLYYNRAVVKLKLGKTNEACNDLEIAIKKGDEEAQKLYDIYCK